MTRETKIGLLVGLAFIIVIGILLSDHLTSSTEPPPATLANAGSNVMQTVNTPGSTGAAQAQQITAPQVQPNQTVPTAADLTPRPQPVQIVQVGPGAQPQPITIQSQQPAGQEQPVSSPPVTVAQNPADDAPVITYVPQRADSSLAEVAQQNGEGLVALDASGRPTGAAAPGWTEALANPANSRQAGMKEHKCEPGDSVSRLAGRYLGGNTKTNRDLIIRANPSLQKDPNRMIVGQTYLIPTPGQEPAVALVPADQPQTPGATVASVTEYWYTVKEGDSLWKIANEQLGKPAAVPAIKELNKDSLRGGDTVYVGMKLKLPGKPLAQAR